MVADTAFRAPSITAAAASNSPAAVTAVISRAEARAKKLCLLSIYKFSLGGGGGLYWRGEGVGVGNLVVVY